MIWLVSTALAHPFETDEYSYRTELKASDKGLVGLVVLEIPITKVLEGIGVEDGDSKMAKRKKADAFTEGVYSTMAAGLTVTLDGAAHPVEWRPPVTEMNGKAAEGFFLYMVSFHTPLDELPAEGYSVAVSNAGYPDEPMVYSGGVGASEPWTVTTSTAHTLLGEDRSASVTDEARWSRDDAFRQFSATFARPSGPGPQDP